MDLASVAFEHAPIGIAVVDLDGRCRRANAALARLLDTDPERLLGAPLPLMSAELERVLCGQQGTVEYELAHAAPGADVRSLLVRAAAGQPGSVVISVHDVTARTRAESELREREAIFRAVFEDSSVGMALVGADGRFVKVP